MASLEDQFHHAMIGVYENAKDHDCFATTFKRMFDEHKWLETAKQLLAKQEVQAGLMKLWEMKLLKQEKVGIGVNYEVTLKRKNPWKEAII